MTRIMKPNYFSKFIIFSAVFLSYFGTPFWSIDIGFMQLSFIRIIAFILIPVFMLKMQIHKYRDNFIFGYDIGYCPIYLLLFWLAYAVLSIIWCPDIKDGIRAIYFLAGALLYALSFSVTLNCDEDIYKCIWLSFAAILIHSAIGWYEIFTHNYHFLYDPIRERTYAIAFLPVSGSYNVNDYATLILFGILFSFCIYRQEQNKLVKIFAGASLLNFLALLFWSRSRANILGLIMVALAFLFLYRKKTMTILKNVFPFIIIIFFVLLYFVNSSDFVISALTDQIFSFDTQSAGGSDYIRMNLIKNGLIFLKDNLLMGVGAGGIESTMLEKQVFDTGGIINMHNWWMEILTSFGIFVFWAYLITYYKLCKKFRDNVYNNPLPLQRTLAITFLGCYISYIIASISSSSNMGNDSFWVFFAISIAYYKILKKRVY